MKLYKGTYYLEKKLGGHKAQNHSVGFIPTMGALHKGHLSLIELAKRNCDIVVCSIFVNPTQFNDNNDFKNYPITIEEDLKLLNSVGCDYVFVPSVQTIYPNNLNTVLKLELGHVAQTLEGKYRPGHFDGVIQVVKRLLDIVNPNVLFLGDKDFQQCLVIEQMISYFKLPIKVVNAPTIREDDGLAMSSRNKRLTPKSREAALLISQYLDEIVIKARTESLKGLINYYYNRLNEHPLIRVEYLEIVDSIGLLPLSSNTSKTSARVLIAAYVDGVRLIDNKAIPNFVIS